MTMWRVLAVGVCLFATACGGGQEPTGGIAEAAQRQAAYDDFADCLRDQGANVGHPVLSPDGSVQLPPGDAGALSSVEELSRAAARCQPILSARGLPPPGPVTLSDHELADLRRRSKAFAGCLRTEGIDWPDPEWDGGAIVNWDPEAVGVDLDDPDVQRIGEDCSARTGFDPMLAHSVDDEQT
ncbi:MAG TPA: hypothetical protein VNU01_11630 [Egibacteraceae bacterium]|nr:hypothetical protein [Egibacteraceae bacterium]